MRPGISPAARRLVSMRGLTSATVVAWIVFWHARADGRLSADVLLCAVVFVAACVAYGKLFERFTAHLVPNRVGATYRLLSGFLVFNSLLFAMTLLAPLGILVDAAILAAAPFVALALLPRRQPVTTAPAPDEWPGLLCVLVAGLAASLWAADLQPATDVRGDVVVFRGWVDMYIHVREISAFAQAHGFSSMSDIKMLGMTTAAYHFASYVSTAAFSAWTSTTALVNFGAFQLPFGVLLMAVASFVLVGTIWSPWPALASVVAVVAFPDAYQQGFGAGYLGFDFMSQVNLTMLYGLACVSLAWLFMIEGCRRSSFLAVVVAYVFLALTLSYKAHVFVANAYLMLVFPCFFFTGLKRRWRIGAWAIATAIYVAVIALSKGFPGVPTIRLDGSGAGAYLRILYLGFDDGLLRRLLRWALIEHDLGRLINAIIGTLLIVFGSFGIWALVAPGVFWKLRHRLPGLVLAFTGLVFVNYWVMSLGLAMDERHIATPEELLNRPMAWAYFAVVSFTAAAVYALAAGEGGRRSARAHVFLGLFAIVSLASVCYHSRGAQTFGPLRQYRDYASFNAVPLCEVRAADYLRTHSRVTDVVQDSADDGDFVIGALSERQAYVVASVFAGGTPIQSARLRTVDLASIKADPDDLDALAARGGINWYVLHPEETARWPRRFLDRAAFTCGDYRVIPLLR
jgi:hypothetical protein